ncbi:MAG: DNRLRE domain-containing protein, partial [Acetobacter sp.]|nr:DNRLRE domain-containing protein [Acetobacter sp.]
MEVNTTTVHDSDAPDELQLSSPEDNLELNAEVLYEDTSKRSENIKHFRMRNGSYMAAVYEKPVHVFDQTSGRFVDIPHKFEEHEDCFEAETAHFKAHFPKKEGKRKYVSVEKDGRCIRWRYLPQASSHRKHAVAAATFHQRANAMELLRFPRLQYKKTESSVDLEYGIDDNGVKENIILHKNPKSTAFRFDLQLTGLKAILSHDKKSVYVLDVENEDGEPLFVIPPANMTDAAGAYSEAAHYALVENKNSLILELIADPDWLLAKDRLYPVTVDPQVTIPASRYSSTLTMATVCSDGSTVSSGNYRRVGVDECGNIHRLFIKPTLPSLPESAKITKATLALYDYKCEYRSGFMDYMVYPVDPKSNAWSGNTITWSNAPNIVTSNL